MGKKENTPVVIDGEEFTYEEMTKEQQMLVNHIADLDRKIGSMQFNLDQLNVGKQAFVNMLKEALLKDGKVEVVAE